MSDLEKKLELGRYPIYNPIEERRLLFKPHKQYEGKIKTFRITHLPKEILKCVKCSDTNTILEPCNNCGSLSDFTLYGDCIKCNRKHQQKTWICSKCNCKNPLEKTLYHYIQIEGPINEGCFIATVCYDDYNSREVMVLRQFRDNKLLKSFVGTFFVKFYYCISPKLASLISKSNTVKGILRKYILEPIISRLEKQDEN